MACQECHKRKVRCDVLKQRPCSHCTASNDSCTPPAWKQKSRKAKFNIPRGLESSFSLGTLPESRPSRSPIQAETRDHPQGDNEGADAHLTNVPLSSAGRVTCMGETSLPKVHGTEIGLQVLDILDQAGAFSLPLKPLRDDLVDSFFKWVAPILPVINETRFRKQYQSIDSQSEDSHFPLLLLQAILLAGSRACTNPELIGVNDSTTTAGSLFYMRSKALYDYNYERDQVVIVQALTLMGWYCAGDIMRDACYWTGLAVMTAQNLGMNRRVEQTNLSKEDRRLWKRIWWTLFTRDRSIATVLCRPAFIDTSACDVEMICEDDFIESNNNGILGDPLCIQFFLQYVKVCNITGLVLSQYYSIGPRVQCEGSTNPTDPVDSGNALLRWFENCPAELFWEETQHNFWSGLLHGSYYTTLCLLYSTHLLPAARIGTENSTLSRHNAFHAASRITSIVDALSTHNELRYCPEFMIFSLYAALQIHAYQLQPNVSSGVRVTQERIDTCISAIKDLSRIWLIDKARFEMLLSQAPQEPLMNEQDRGTKIIEQEAGQSPLEEEFHGTVIEFNQTFQPGQQCLEGFVNMGTFTDLDTQSGVY